MHEFECLRLMHSYLVRMQGKRHYGMSLGRCGGLVRYILVQSFFQSARISEEFKTRLGKFLSHICMIFRSTLLLTRVI